MVLISSISGIRGMIGGKVGQCLSPIDLLSFTQSYIAFFKLQGKCILIGKDGRISGSWIVPLLKSTLTANGVHYIDLAYTTTPTLKFSIYNNAEIKGGIMVSASHNTVEWNALKLFNDQGGFLNQDSLDQILALKSKGDFIFPNVAQQGSALNQNKDYLKAHIDKILQIPFLNLKKIKKKSFKVAMDVINSSGAVCIPPLLKELGVQLTLVSEGINGYFDHNPEPLSQNLTGLQEVIRKSDFDIGIAVDPDCDRLALVCQDGTFLNEEYTLALVADHVLFNMKGNTVSNMSSSMILDVVSQKHGCQRFVSKVGEAHVVDKMIEVDAVIGGEGNGGIIFPWANPSRDALVGIALILDYMARLDLPLSQIKSQFPSFFIAKKKVTLKNLESVDMVMKTIAQQSQHLNIQTVDGIKIVESNQWVHIRQSNTEPIIRVYAETQDAKRSEILADTYIQQINQLLNP